MTPQKYEQIADEAFAAAYRVTGKYLDVHGEDGEAGTVYVTIKPAGSPMAEYLRYYYGARKRTGHTGLMLSNPCGYTGTSLRAKEVGANAFADVCIRHGINATVLVEHS